MLRRCTGDRGKVGGMWRVKQRPVGCCTCNPMLAAAARVNSSRRRDGRRRNDAIACLYPISPSSSLEVPPSPLPTPDCDECSAEAGNPWPGVTCRTVYQKSSGRREAADEEEGDVPVVAEGGGRNQPPR
jgi:hypothetical protein